MKGESLHKISALTGNSPEIPAPKKSKLHPNPRSRGSGAL
jgi:hypothetical protein